MVRGTGRGGEGRLEPRRVKEEHELYVCPIRRHCVRPAENVFSAFSGSFLVEERNVVVYLVYFHPRKGGTVPHLHQPPAPAAAAAATVIATDTATILRRSYIWRALASLISFLDPEAVFVTLYNVIERSEIPTSQGCLNYRESLSYHLSGGVEPETRAGRLKIFPPQSVFLSTYRCLPSTTRTTCQQLLRMSTRARL